LPKHPTTIQGCGTLQELAESIGDLRYDALQALFHLLFQKFHLDAEKDCERGRQRLANLLIRLSIKMEEATEICEEMWKICEPHMRNSG